MANKHLTFILFTLSLTLLVTACEKPPQAKNSQIKSVVKPKADIKPNCLPSTGSAMEDGEVTVCHYDTDSLELAYAAIVKENASKDDFGYALLKKTLPAKNLEDKFDDKQTWIKYAWLDKAHVTVTIQMAGGEDTIEFAKENANVKVVTTLSAD